MAWTEKLPSGRYRGLYRDADSRKRVAGTYPHKPAAMDAAVAAETAVRGGQEAAPYRRRLTLGALAEDWLATRVVEKRTAERHRQLVDSILSEFGAATNVETIRPSRVARWVADLTRDGQAPATIRKKVYCLAGILDVAVNDDVIPGNPARRVTLPKPSPPRDRWVEVADALRLVEGMPAGYGAAALLLASVGMRWGELAGAHVDQVDMLRRTFTVSRTLIEPQHGPPELKPYPKDPRSSRPVPLPRLVVDTLAAHLAAHPPRPCGLAHPGRERCSGLLLSGLRGGPLSRQHFQKRFNDAAAAVGLEPGLRPHDLRHTAASLLAQDDVPLTDIAKQLGHSQLSTTERYAHLKPGASEAVRASMDRLWVVPGG